MQARKCKERLKEFVPARFVREKQIRDRIIIYVQGPLVVIKQFETFLQTYLGNGPGPPSTDSTAVADAMKENNANPS